MKNTTYADAGVDADAKRDVSRILYRAARETWKNREGKFGQIIVPSDDFSGRRAIDVSNLPKGTVMNMNFDGVGTKIEIAERMKNHETIAHDLFAMVCDDAAVQGGEPVLIGTILDVNTLKNGNEMTRECLSQIAKGYVNAAREANVAVVNGEVAELGSRVKGHGPFNYNWGAAVTWFAREEQILTGKNVKEGDYLIGFREYGFRSNGISLVRKVLETAHGEEWHKVPFEDRTLGEDALQPSQIYTRALVDMIGGVKGTQNAELHGAAHITGGGIPEKLGRALRESGLGAVIDNPYQPTSLMKYCQKEGRVSDKEAYKTWNMGQGAIVISPQPEHVIRIASTHGIEAKVIGKITAGIKGIHIKNKGHYLEHNYLFF